MQINETLQDDYYIFVMKGCLNNVLINCKAIRVNKNTKN